MINAYDFDGTIYDGDSSKDFYAYCIKRSPSLIKYLPGFVIAIFLYAFKLKNKEYLKEKFFAINKGIKNIDLYVDDFWNKNQFKIKKWYISQKKESDVVISASPFFLLQPICNRLGLSDPIATIIDKKTGKCLGKNCHDNEKIKRYEQLYPKNSVNAFYTDSIKSDRAMLEYAKNGYIVKKDEVTRWK